MGMLNAKKQVMKQVRGKDPRQIAFWFLDKSLILLKESQVAKTDVLKHIDEMWNQ